MPSSAIDKKDKKNSKKEDEKLKKPETPSSLVYSNPLNSCRFCLKTTSSTKRALVSTGCSCSKLHLAHSDCLLLYITSTGVCHCSLCGGQEFKQADGSSFSAVLQQQKKEVKGGESGGQLIIINSPEAYYATSSSLFDRLLIGLLFYLFVVHIAPEAFEGEVGGALFSYVLGHLAFYLLQKVMAGGLRSLDLYRYFKAKQEMKAMVNGQK